MYHWKIAGSLLGTQLLTGHPSVRYPLVEHPLLERLLKERESAGWSPVRETLLGMRREVEITWRAIGNDYNVTLVPILLFMAVLSSKTPGADSVDLVMALVCGMLYALPFIAQFNYSNQLISVEEDRLEKPFRPIPAGLITRRGAILRYALWLAAFLIVGAALGALRWALLWAVITIFHNFLGGDRHYLSKNVISLGLGCFAQLGAVWAIAGLPMTGRGLFFTIGVAVWLGLLVNLQDLRDVRGDLEARRRTLPIVLGLRRTRGLLAVLTLFFGAALCVGLVAARSGSASFPVALAVALGLFVWHLVIAGRLLFLTGRDEDAVTYKFHFSFLYCALLASGAVFL